MKKLLFAIMCAVMLCGPLPVLAGEYYPWQFTFTSTAPSGVSYWVVPYHQQKLDGKFTLGLIAGGSGSGTSIVQGIEGATSGTTLTADFACTSMELTAAQIAGTAAMPKLNWHSGFAAMAVDTGNTQYVYSLTTNVEPSKNMVLRFTTGVTNLTFTAEVIAW